MANTWSGVPVAVVFFRLGASMASGIPKAIRDDTRAHHDDIVVFIVGEKASGTPERTKGKW
jgi:hypothetical protein